MTKYLVILSWFIMALTIFNMPSLAASNLIDIKSTIPVNQEVKALEAINKMSVEAKTETLMLSDKTKETVTFTRISVVNDESLSDSEKIALLVKAIQELEAKISKLEGVK